MKITGYKILSVLGMLILHSLPFIVYKYAIKNHDFIFGMFLSLIMNISVIRLSGVYDNLFKVIHELMKKEIKLW